MPAYIYGKAKLSEGFQYTRRSYVPIAGHNVIYNLWQKKGYREKTGWKITSEELIQDILKSNDDVTKYSVIIDSAPSLKAIVDLKEIHDIHLYTYVDEKTEKVDWSVICLRVKDIFYMDRLDNTKKRVFTEKFISNKQNEDMVYSFLYIHGDKRGWNWGRLGQMNGAWLYSDARKYFQKLLNE